ncbi:diaminopimelate epimerase [Methylobrevis pamukkalensis]
MNGIGNEIVVLDLRAGGVTVTPEAARAIGATPGAHFDQLMVLYPPRAAGLDATMKIFNIDGSLSAACGNGTRCVGLLLMAAEAKSSLLLQSDAGLLTVKDAGDGMISVDMGKPKFGWADIPLAEPFQDTRYIELQIGPIDRPVLHSPSVVNVGNPHAIFWVDDVTAHDLGRFGPMLENHPIFPERANISLAEVLSPDHVRVKVWERGAGLTQACGSAACAVAVAAARTRRTGRHVRISLPGGDLVIDWRDDDRIVMTGPAELEHVGELPAAIFAGVAAA